MAMCVCVCVHSLSPLLLCPPKDMRVARDCRGESGCMCVCVVLLLASQRSPERDECWITRGCQR